MNADNATMVLGRVRQSAKLSYYGPVLEATKAPHWSLKHTCKLLLHGVQECSSLDDFVGKHKVGIRVV
jgi:hypothetical protein